METGKKITALVLMIGVWQILSLFYSPVILPSPWLTLQTLISSAGSSSFYRALGISALRLLAGLGFSVVLGLTVGILMGVSRTMKVLLNPVVYLLQSTPPILFLTLAMIWFGLSGKATIFIVAVVSFPVLAVSLYEGFNNIDRKLIEMAGIFRFSKGKILTEIILPSLTTYVKSGMIIMLGLSWKLLIMSEVLSAGSGIGAQLTDARMNLETEKVFAWGLIVIILCILSQKSISSGLTDKRMKKEEVSL